MDVEFLTEFRELLVEVRAIIVVETLRKPERNKQPISDEFDYVTRARHSHCSRNWVSGCVVDCDQDVSVSHYRDRGDRTDIV
jgi:hypothetical protein